MVVFLVLLSITLLSSLYFSFSNYARDNHHFVYLANAFAHGSFSVNNLPPDYIDKVQIGGDTFIPLAPMPAILLVPLVDAFGIQFDDLWLAYLFTAANALLLWLLLKRLSVPAFTRRYLLPLFLFGTVYLSSLVVARSYFLSHIMATTFLLLAINETVGERREPLIGFWLGASFLTRSPTIFSLPFFIWMLKPKDASWVNPTWVFSVSYKLVLGLAAPLAFYFYYNYARFNNPLETGYGSAVLLTTTLTEARQVGLFNLAHVPKNLYSLLLAAPQAYPSFSSPTLSFPYVYPSPWGMGLFFTTPAFAYIFAADWHKRIARAAWLAIGLVLLPLVLYYGVGWIQFGFRYALDFYPFLFILVALGMANRFDRLARLLITLSIAINLWGAWWQMIGFFMLPPNLQR